jgi:predicted MPP superfamily phosphohydrolase
MRGVAAGSPRLMLLHNPILVPWLVREYPLDAILCGHTHGGQFRVPILTDQFVQATEYFVRGRYDLGRTQLYVNRGFGFTGPPLRFRVRPELTMITLVPA